MNELYVCLAQLVELATSISEGFQEVTLLIEIYPNYYS